MSREKENYKSLLDKARVVANAASSSDAGSQRLGSKGRSSKGRSRFIDENDADKLRASLIPRRGEESSVIEEGSITKLFNKVFASNQSTKELVRQYQDGSTSAMTSSDGKPVDILNKGGDVSIEKNVNPSKYGKKLFQDIEETLGLEPHQVAGLVGNFDHETGGFKFMKEINPVVKGSRGGLNFAQWTGSRHDNLLNYAKENNLKPDSYAAGFGFFIDEVQNTREGKFLEKLQASKTVEEAATIVSEKYLRPGKPMLSKRIALSKSYLEN